MVFDLEACVPKSTGCTMTFHPKRDVWESKMKTIKDDILAHVESHLSVIQQQYNHPFMNGSAKLNGQGLVAPPSPHSLSSDSMRLRSTRKQNRSSCRRTKSPSQVTMPPDNIDSDEDNEPALISNNGSVTSPRSQPRSPWTTDKSSDLEAHIDRIKSSWLASTKSVKLC